MRFFLYFAGMIFCASLSAPMAVAQILPQPLTLEQALERARSSNPDLQGARIAVRQLEGAYEHANTPVPSNPRVSLQSYQQEQMNGSVDTGIGLQVSQELWLAGQGGLRESAAQSRLDAARARLDFLTSSIAARTRAAFLQSLVAEQAVTTAQQIVAANAALNDFAERRLEAGEATQLEVNITRIGLGRARALLADAQNQRQRAHLLLADLLWVDPATPLDLGGSIESPELQIPGRNTLLNRAVQRRGDLAAAAQAVFAAREDLKLARRQLVPNLNVFATSNSDTNIDRGSLVGLSFELPLLHRYGGERKQAAAALEAAQLERDTLQFAVRSEVLGALADYEAGVTQLNAMSEEVLDAATQNFDLTMQAFEAGELDAPALTTAQSVLVTTRDEYLRALNNLVRAGTDLERATGGLLIMSTNSPVPTDTE